MRYRDAVGNRGLEDEAPSLGRPEGDDGVSPWGQLTGGPHEEASRGEILHESAMATSLDFVPERLTARRTASPTASASTMAFSLIEDGGVGSAAYDSTR